MTVMNYAKQASKEMGARGVVFDKAKEFKSSSGKGNHKVTKTYLNVPYREKDDAKFLGARWDHERKQWYCISDNWKFKQWMDGDAM